LYPKAAADSAEENSPPATEAALPSTPLPTENAAAARARADALRAAADADIYMHSPVEVVALEDLDRAARLLAGFCAGLPRRWT
jgi:putative aminopeptidase FrvX